MLPFAYKPVQLKLESLGGSADLRMAKSKAVCATPPLGVACCFIAVCSLQGPVVTDNGGLILDWKFTPNKARYSSDC